MRNSRLSCAGLFVLLLAAQAARAHDVDILSKRYTLAEVEQIVQRAGEDWRFPRAAERDRWLAIPEALRRAIVASGEEVLDYRYTGIPATSLLEDTSNGTYRQSADVQHSARRALLQLVLAEAVEYEGRFLDAIVDIVWAICEESSWATLSHYYLHAEGDEAKLVLALPDVSDAIVDLWAAETAKNLAWTYYLLGEKFDGITPRINDRMKFEVQRRLLRPLRERDDFWWMGFSGGNNGIINNWNSWIGSNWLPAILAFESGSEKAAAIHKLLRVTDRFLNHYSSDGGLDEGPGYWWRAGGSLFETLQMLDHWSNGAINIFSHAKVRNIMQYVYATHIHDRHVVNFADASPTIQPDVPLLFELGVVLDDDIYKQFARYLIAQEESSPVGIGVTQPAVSTDAERPTGARDIDRALRALFLADSIVPTGAAAPPYIRDIWYDGVQQMIARDYDGSHQGFFLAAKGGHNNESHNHNDVGNFIVYHNGTPVIVDVGSASYTLETFGADRYSRWNLRSEFHTVPTINGTNQPPGPSYAAESVGYSVSAEAASLTMNLAPAYADNASVEAWWRTISLNRGSGVVLRDRFSLSAVHGETGLNFLTPRNVRPAEGGLVLGKEGEQAVFMEFSQERLNAAVEPVHLDDPQMQLRWGQERMYRIRLVSNDAATRGDWEIRFTELQGTGSDEAADER